MYVTQRSFAVPAPAIRDFFWLYHTYSLLRGGFYNASSGFGLWAKTLRGQLRGGFYNASSGFGPEAKTLRGQLFSSFQFLGLNEQAQVFGLGSFDLKFYRLTKINRKAENYAISTQQQLEMELPFLLGSDRESEPSGKKSVI